MRRMKVKPSILAIAFCAILSVVFCGVIARADEDYSFALTVNATASTDKSFVAEVKRADMVVDVYKIATAVEDPSHETYDYTWDVERFAGLKDQFETVSENRESTASDWQELYDAAAKIVADSKLEPSQDPVSFADGKAEVKLTGKGIYLVMARGAVEDYGAGVAYSDRYKFTFPATMVAAPTKWADESGDMAGVIYTDDARGAWHDEATINLKSSWEPLFGRLIIDKAVDNYGGEETTFVFRVRNVATDNVGLGELYDEYASVTLNGSATGSTELTHIPAQLKVQIEETYAGGRYKYVSTEWITDNVILSDHDVENGKGYETEAQYAEVLINNKRGGDNPGGGHGVENHFSYEDASGNWPIAMRPEKPHTATTE